MSRQPEVLWAQRSDKVYLTVALPDAKDVSVKCEPQGLFSFSASGVQDSMPPVILWGFSADSFRGYAMATTATSITSLKCRYSELAICIPSHNYMRGCKIKSGLRNILCSVQKQQKGWWKRLLKSEEKPAPYLKVDWNKWCDEDDEESASDTASDDDARFVGQDDGSSDEEGMLYLPDLEKARG